MKRLCLILCLAAAAPAHADVAETVRDHALPGLARFAAATATLAAETTCEAAPLQARWNDAFDAWLGIAHLRLGPMEEEGRALAIAFWPDPKGIGARQTEALRRAADPAMLAPASMAEQSVALRGLFGLERLLYAPAAPQGYDCDLIHALSRDLARMAAETRAGWQDGFAAALLHPGPGGRYLTETETRQALLTALITGLEFNADTRIGRPLGTFDTPRPERAEARASGRSARNIALSLAALRDLATRLHQPIPQTEAAFDRAIAQAGAVDLARLAEPQMWLKADILAQSIRAARDAALAELGPALGAGVGFNAADGD